MSKADAIESMMGRLTAQFGVIDILVNNAGIQHVAPVDEFPVDKLERDPRDQPDRVVPSDHGSCCRA